MPGTEVQRFVTIKATAAELTLTCPTADLLNSLRSSLTNVNTAQNEQIMDPNSHHPNNIWWRVQIWSSSLYNFLQLPVTSSAPCSQILSIHFKHIQISL